MYSLSLSLNWARFEGLRVSQGGEMRGSRGGGNRQRDVGYERPNKTPLLA